MELQGITFNRGGKLEVNGHCTTHQLDGYLRLAPIGYWFLLPTIIISNHSALIVCRV